MSRYLCLFSNTWKHSPKGIVSYCFLTPTSSVVALTAWLRANRQGWGDAKVQWEGAESCDDADGCTRWHDMAPAIAAVLVERVRSLDAGNLGYCELEIDERVVAPPASPPYSGGSYPFPVAYCVDIVRELDDNDIADSKYRQ